MAGRGLLPDVPRLLALVEEGKTHQQIGDMFGTTRQAVSLKLRGATAPKYRRREWPWEVESRHKAGWMYEAISYYVMATAKERPLTRRQRQHLTSFLGMLDTMPGDYVVDYYPDTPVGFKLRERRPDDDPESLLAATT